MLHATNVISPQLLCFGPLIHQKAEHNHCPLFSFRSQTPQCLIDNNHEFFYSYDLDHRPPGQIISRDTQCKLVFGENSTLCHVSRHSFYTCTNTAFLISSNPFTAMHACFNSTWRLPVGMTNSAQTSGATTRQIPPCAKRKRGCSHFREQAAEITRWPLTIYTISVSVYINVYTT